MCECVFIYIGVVQPKEEDSMMLGASCSQEMKSASSKAEPAVEGARVSALWTEEERTCG